MSEQPGESAEAVFARWSRARKEPGTVAFDVLCRENPDLAERLAELHEDWLEKVRAVQGREWMRGRRRRRIRVRVAAWGVVLLLALGVHLYFRYRFRAWIEAPRGIDPSEVRAVLEGGPHASLPERDHVAYQDVLAAFHEFEWAPDRPTPPGLAPPPVELVAIAPSRGTVVVEFTAESGLSETSLSVGDTLPAPYEHFRLDSVGRTGATLELELPDGSTKRMWVPLKDE